MKLATIATEKGPRLAAVRDGRNVDLAAVDSTIPACLKRLLSEADGLDRARKAAELGWQSGRLIEGRLLAPIARPGKVICIGLNYRDHARETGAEIPPEPVVFNKFPSSVIGPAEAIRLPAVCREVDYEAELVVVIGRTGRNIVRERAFAHVAGYMNGNDVSARDWQLHKPGRQWLLGKSPDTFAPTGPWLVTPDELPDPHALRVAFKLNGAVMQDSTTRELIFGIDALLAYVSQVATLEPGDVIFTGTPSGVGMGRQPPVWLKPGDVCEVEIEGLGVLRNPVA
ncbi:MAG: fumarylacetoacetate hydrolase family protein [Planctomycetaceae bacterium]